MSNPANWGSCPETTPEVMAGVAGFLTLYQAGGTADAQTITLDPEITEYNTKLRIVFKPVADNTGACTLNVNSLGAKSIKLLNGNDPYPGALNASGVHIVQYDGTNFVLTNPYPAHRGALVYLNNNYSLANGVGGTAIPWEGEDYDTDGFWVVGSPSRFTIPAGVSKVRVSANVVFATSSTGLRALRFFKNGDTFRGTGHDLIQANTSASVHDRIGSMSAVVSTTANDYFECVPSQNTGGALNIEAANQTWFCIEVLE